VNRPFAESFLNRDDHVVLRRRLLPLSLWHLLNLEIAQSPYFLGGSFPTTKDLRLAVAVCTTSFPRLPDLSGRRLIWNWLRTWNCRFLIETAKFRAYLEDFNALPQLWRQEEKRTPGAREAVGLPWALAIVSGICGSTGWSAETAWNLPVGQAYWYHVAFAMQKGAGVDLLSEGEMLAIEKVRARRAAGRG
jgi:hypothetical protein